MKNYNFSAVSIADLYPNYGYLFLNLSRVERILYMFWFFLYKLSENDADNVLEFSIAGIAKLHIKGVKDIIIFLCLLVTLMFAAFR